MRVSSLIGLLETIRRRLRVWAGGTLGLTAVAVFGFVLVLAFLLAGGDGWTPGTAVPLSLLIGGGLIVAGIASITLLRLARWTRDSTIASQAERAAALPSGSVRAQVELLREVPEGVSPVLASAGEGALLDRLEGSSSDLAGESGQRFRRWFGLALAGAVVGLGIAGALLMVAPDRARAAWSGLAQPTTLLRTLPLGELQVRPGDVRLPRGEMPLVEVTAPGRDSITLHWRATGDLPQARSLAVVADRTASELPPLDGELRYWATSPDGSRTREYVMTPEDPALLTDVTIEASFPPHTRLPTEVFQGTRAALVLPEGTRLSVRGGVEGASVDLSLVPEDDESAVVSLPVEEGRFSGSWIPRRSGRLHWIVEGGQEGALLPAPLEIEILPDLPPRLSLTLPGVEGDLPLSLQVPALLEAEDDYGVSWLEIETTLRDRSGATGPPVVDRIESSDRPTVTVRTTLDFRNWDILPGDEVLIRARAADNAPSPGIVQSELFTLRMPLREELRDLARGRIEEAASRSEEIAERAVQEREDLRNMERQASLEQQRAPASDDASERFQEREELRQALERQLELADDIDDVRELLEEIREALPEDHEADAGLRERIEELERMLEDVLGPEARQRLEEILDQLRQGEVPDSPGEVLRDALDRQDSLQSRLEQAMERLRRSMVEESFRSAEEEIESLLAEQRQLSEQLADGEGAEAQEELARRTEAVEERVAELEERLREGGDEETAERTAEAGNELQESRQAMEDAARESEAGNNQDAADSADDAAESLENALQGLEEARADWEEEWEEEMREGLRQGAQDALALSRRQADLRQEFRNAGPIRRSQFEGDQAALLEGVRSLGGQLAEATRQNPDLGTPIAESIRAAEGAASRAIEGLHETAAFQAATDTAAGEAQRALQEIALLALAGLEDAGGSEAPAAAGASAEQILAELEELAQGQESLNRDSRALGEDPGTDGITSRIEELSRAQEAIASSLGELSREPGAGEIPGSLESLSEEGEEISRELSEGRLDATTLDRQDQFLERLLSAGRTLERDGPTEEREGTTAEVVERGAVSPLPDYLLESLALPIPSAEELEILSPGQRRLVLDYFERVNRREAGGDGP
jgi:hypothetical protein